MERIRIVDTHTGGEPTRVVLSSPIVFDSRSMAERRREFHAKFDRYRQAIVCEPRGSDVMVGALLTEPEMPGSAAGVIFFNNVGSLGMCGHGMIGVAAALYYLKSIGLGQHRIDTPVGTVQLELQSQSRVQLQNVPSYRWRSNVPVALPSGQVVHGDVAWGGNWFYICEDHGLAVELENLRRLEALSREIRQQLGVQSILGELSAEIDHIELVGPPSSPLAADARNFVLCPGGAYDRSPCGTGTSAKIACLAADDKLSPGEIFRQESIVGSVFSASFAPLDGDRILPIITGAAHVNAQGELLLAEEDPFCFGIASARWT